MSFSLLVFRAADSAAWSDGWIGCDLPMRPPRFLENNFGRVEGAKLGSIWRYDSSRALEPKGARGPGGRATQGSGTTAPGFESMEAYFLIWGAGTVEFTGDTLRPRKFRMLPSL